MNKVKIYQRPRSKILREERQLLKQKLWVIEAEKEVYETKLSHQKCVEKTMRLDAAYANFLHSLRL